MLRIVEQYLFGFVANATSGRNDKTHSGDKDGLFSDTSIWENTLETIHMGPWGQVCS